MNRAIKYRIYPSAKQRELFSKTFGCCRKIYNLMLTDKITSYKSTGSFGKQTPAMYKPTYPYLKEVDSLALANVQLHLQQAMKNCLSSKHCAFPVFKSAKHSRRSYTTNNQHGTVAIIGNSIKLPKVGLVKAKIHRAPDSDWIVKSATISQEPNGAYYVSVLFEYDTQIMPVTPTKAIGLDYKSDGLYIDSDGNVGSNHKYYRESQAKLVRMQRKLSRMKPHSSNYEKHRRKIAKFHAHIKNQRLDNLHKLSTEIANSYDVICVESLNMRAMSNRGFGNGKATLDNGYGLFLTMLEYKLADRGKYLIKINKWYPSSQICSCCGNRKQMKLSDRTYRCTCGATLDRDYNAAINILKEGLRLLNEVA